MESDIDPPSTPLTNVNSWVEKLGPGLDYRSSRRRPERHRNLLAGGRSVRLRHVDALLTYPLMVAIQVISARIGRVSGHGLATNIRRHYPAWLL